MSDQNLNHTPNVESRHAGRTEEALSVAMYLRLWGETKEYLSNLDDQDIAFGSTISLLKELTIEYTSPRPIHFDNILKLWEEMKTFPKAEEILQSLKNRDWEIAIATISEVNEEYTDSE